jgi:hypothetical protein
MEVVMSRSFRAGLIVLGVLSALDLLGPLLTDGEHPPMAVALVGSVIGLASLALVVSAWRGATRATIPLVILRLLSALAAVPAFLEPGVPGPAMAAAAAGIALTVVGVALTLSGAQRPATAGAR